MFVETITTSRELWEAFSSRIRLVSDPPDALAVSVAWQDKDGRVTVLNVWDDPAAIGDFYMERTRHVIDEVGEPEEKPQRHGPPLEVYIRR